MILFQVSARPALIGNMGCTHTLTMHVIQHPQCGAATLCHLSVMVETARLSVGALILQTVNLWLYGKQRWRGKEVHLRFVMSKKITGF